MATKEPGYVYILTNPSFREDWVKIGMTQNMEERLRTLDTTALPLPFKKYATMKTVKYQVAEKHVHHYIERFTNLRIRANREFFNVTPEEALSIFREVAELLDDAEIEVFDENTKKQYEKETAQKKTARRPPFKFSMIGLRPGDVVYFEHGDIPVTVVSENTVAYDSEIYTLSRFCKHFMPDEGSENREYQGPAHFLYNGRTLDDIRKEKEKNII